MVFVGLLIRAMHSGRRVANFRIHGFHGPLKQRAAHRALDCWGEPHRYVSHRHALRVHKPGSAAPQRPTGPIFPSANSPQFHQPLAPARRRSVGLSEAAGQDNDNPQPRNLSVQRLEFSSADRPSRRQKRAGSSIGFDRDRRRRLEANVAPYRVE